MTKVLKFGGTSVGTAARIKGVVEIVLQSTRSHQSIVVVSALSGVTDQLIEICRIAAGGKATYRRLLAALEARHVVMVKELMPGPAGENSLTYLTETFGELRELLHGVNLLKEQTPRTLDLVMSFGERLSAYLVAQAITMRGHQSISIDARGLVRTDAHFGAAHVDLSTTYTRIRRTLTDRSVVYVVTGFIGATSRGETTTLGRGGSDYTATLVGAALNVDQVEIWTDVDGVMTADPRKVPTARHLDRLRYIEAAELSHFGAKVIYPPTIRPATETSIPILIKNTLRPESPGTLINSQPRKEQLPITGISSIRDIGLLQIQGSGLPGHVGTAERLFRALAAAEVNVILISQASSEYSICVAMLESEVKRAKSAVEREFQHELRTGQIDGVEIESNHSILAVVGEHMRHSPGMAGNIFGALGEAGINVVAIAQGSSELNISIVVRREDEVAALKAIHDTFFPAAK